MDENPNGIMADTLITGTTLIEKESRSIGDIPVGGFVEWDDTFGNLPDGFVLADGSTVNDPLSAWDGTAVQDLNTNYFSITGNAWQSANPDTDQVALGNNRIRADETVILSAPVFLPNGATVTSAIVYGNAAAEAETWTLGLTASNTGAAITALASAAFNTADSTISNAVIDNNTNVYWFKSSSIDVNDEIWGAEITYTPRNKFIMRIR